LLMQRSQVSVAYPRILKGLVPEGTKQGRSLRPESEWDFWGGIEG